MTAPNLTEPLDRRFSFESAIPDTDGPGSSSFEVRLRPKDARVYRIRIRKKPRPGYIEVIEDQIEAEPTRK